MPNNTLYEAVGGSAGVLRLARAWHGGNAEQSAAVTEDVLLGGAGKEVIHRRPWMVGGKGRAASWHQGCDGRCEGGAAAQAADHGLRRARTDDGHQAHVHDE